MGVLHVRISDELDKAFRIGVIEKYGTSKGVLSNSVQEALKLWLKENSPRIHTQESKDIQKKLR